MKESDRFEINTLEELILVLNNCEINKTENCYLNAMRRVNIEIVEWEKNYIFNDEHPSKSLLAQTDDYELYLSCWEKGQEGEIHDISSEEAWIHPICGEFLEERYKLANNKLEQVSSVVLNCASHSYMQKSKTIFKYTNIYETRSVCLHLNSHPIKVWKVYNEKTGNTHMPKQLFDKGVN
jgi:hypothetical protein